MNAQFAYLETEVATACPPKLRLLLIEAALRLAHQSRLGGENHLPHETSHVLRSLKRIILQLLTSVDYGEHTLAEKIKSVYRYLFSRVVEAELTGDTQKLCEVEKVLHVERDTWQILTDRYLAEVAFQQQTWPIAHAPRISTHISPSQPQNGLSRSVVNFDCFA